VSRFDAKLAKHSLFSFGPEDQLSGHKQGLEPGTAIIFAIGANSRQILKSVVKTDMQREAYSTITDRIPPDRLQEVLRSAGGNMPQGEQKADLACQLGGH
jgi:hypothetical protein